MLCSALGGQELKGASEVNAPPPGNNYSRPEGQNVGNFLTDRSSSRVIQPPGGRSQISFGGDEAPLPSPLKTKVTVELPSEEDPPPDEVLAPPTTTAQQHSVTLSWISCSFNQGIVVFGWFEMSGERGERAILAPGEFSGQST